MKKLYFLYKTLPLLFLLLAFGKGLGQTITITNSSIGGTGVLNTNNYNSGTERTWTQNTVTFGGKAVTCNTANSPASGATACQYIQAQASNGVIYNTTALPGRIISVQYTGTASVASTLYVGNTGRLVNNAAANYNVDLNSPTMIGSSENNATHTWTMDASTNYTYFAIKRASSAQYFSSIVITYETTPACTAPTDQPTLFTSSSIGQNAATVGWTGGGDNVLVVARAGDAVNANPGNGTSYMANTAFGSGTQIGTGNYVVYKGTGNSVNLTGLSASTPYHFAIYKYNTTDNCYNLTSPLTGNFITLAPAAATLPYTESFEGTNNWTFVNGSQTNQWAIGTATNNGGTKSLYVSNDNGVTNAYTVSPASAASVVHAYRDITIPAGSTTATLSFDWKSHGEGFSGTYYDYFKVWLVPAAFTPMAGTQITAVANQRIQVGGYFNNQQTFTAFSDNAINVSPYANGTMRLVFEWINDNTLGNQPPGAIDNISVSLPVACTAPTAQPTNLVLSNITNNSIDGSFTAASPSADKYLVVRSTSSTLSGNPINTTTYTVGTALGGGTVVHAGAENTFTTTSLTPSTPYYFFVFAYNDTACTGGPLYNTINPLTGDATTLAGPVAKTYTLVTNASQLEAGKKYLIVNSNVAGSRQALGLQNTNNRAQSAVTVVSGTPNSITVLPASTASGTEPFELTLGGTTGAWTLYDAVNGFNLGPAPGNNSSNYLKENTTATYSISFNGNEVVMTAVTSTNTNGRNIIRYNSSNNPPLFSSYESGQSSIYLYKEGGIVAADTYFRSQANGNWTDSGTWEFSTDGTSWGNASSYPDENASGVTIQAGHTVNINTSNIYITNTKVFGTLKVTTSSPFWITGPDDIELEIENGGVLDVAAFGYPSYSSDASGLVKSGGKLIANPGADKDYFIFDYLDYYGAFIFEDKAIAEWNLPHYPPSSNDYDYDIYNDNVIYPINSTAVPVFRISNLYNDPTYAYGSSADASKINAVLDINTTIPFNIFNSQTKTFTGGIKGTGTVNIMNSSGNVSVGNDYIVPELGGNITLVLPNTDNKFLIYKGGIVPTGATFTIQSNNNTENRAFRRMDGTLNIYGTLDITNVRITNPSNGGINLNDGGILRTRNTGGLFDANSAIPNNINNVNLQPGSTVEYYATADQKISTAKDYYNIILSGGGTKAPSLSSPVKVITSALIKGSPTIDFTNTNFGAASGNITSATLTMTGGTLKLGTAETLPLFTGNYALTGGVIEFANTQATAQTIRNKEYTNSTNTGYQNIVVSGTNVRNSSGRIFLNPFGTFTVNSGAIYASSSPNAPIIGQDNTSMLTVKGGGIFRTEVPLGFYGPITASDYPSVFNNVQLTLESNSTIDYSRTGAQEISYLGALPATSQYSNVVVSGSGEKTVPTDLVKIGNNLTVNPNSSTAVLRIGSNKALSVQNSITNNTNEANFVVESDGNLIQVEDGAVNTGNIKVERAVVFSNSRNEYNFLSSPVYNQNMKELFGAASNTPYAQVLDEPNNVFKVAVAADYLVKGKGFAVKEPKATYTTAVAEFKGVPNNGTINYPVTRAATNRGWNLIGNPYPSNIDIKAIYDASTGITSEFRFWDNTVNATYTYNGTYGQYSYAIFNAANGANGGGTAAPGLDPNGVGGATPVSTKVPNRYVSVGQGFIVRPTTTAGGTVVFNNAKRFPNAPQSTYFGRGAQQAEDDRFQLLFVTPKNIALMQTVTYFDAGSAGFDIDDSKHPGLSSLDLFYSFAEDEKVIISGLPAFDTSAIQPLGYRAYETGMHTIKLYSKEGIFGTGQPIYLVDKLNGIYTDLTQGNYNFSTEAGEFTNRFEIVYKLGATLTTESVQANSILIYQQGEYFVVKSTGNSLREVELFDISGKLLNTLNVTGSEVNFNSSLYPNGVYIVKVKLINGQVAIRKIRK